MAMQNLFARAVNGSLPSAIPTTLERINQFAVGKVLTYQKKPHKLMPWRRHELNFTDRSLTELLAEGCSQELNYTTSTDFLFDAGKSSDKVSVEIGLDGELKAALSALDLKLSTKEQRDLSILTDFCKISYVQSNLCELLHTHQIKVDTNHPVVKEAIEKGHSLFVISTLYQAEHCNVEVSFSQSADTSASVSTQAAAIKGTTGDGNVQDSTTSVKVANRDQPTAIAYLLLRLTIGSHGELTPKLNNRLEQCRTKTSVDMVDGPENSRDEVFGSLEQRYIYHLKEFQCFSSNTYSGILQECCQWVSPIRANSALKQAFLSYVQPPELYEKLQNLSKYLQEAGNALRVSQVSTPNTQPALEPLLAAMSQDPASRLDENTSLLLITEACLEFPQHVILKTFELQAEKRETLLNVIKHTPYGVSRHVSSDSKPFSDPDLYVVMRHMGFSMSDNRHLVYTAPDNTEEDILAAYIILIVLTE